ncbi:hypothetical protein MTO96_032588 [Rhipicephalus appendiculatus]
MFLSDLSASPPRHFCDALRSRWRRIEWPFPVFTSVALTPLRERRMRLRSWRFAAVDGAASSPAPRLSVVGRPACARCERRWVRFSYSPACCDE